MTSASDAQAHRGMAAGVEVLRAKWGGVVALGAVYLLAGLIALYSVATATVVSVFVVGIMMIIAGVAEVINVFQVKSWGIFRSFANRTWRTPRARNSVVAGAGHATCLSTSRTFCLLCVPGTARTPADTLS
jgi:hypothetical protein